jgi:tight adherence protein C
MNLTPEQLLFLVLVFLAVAVLIYALIYLSQRGRAGERLDKLMIAPTLEDTDDSDLIQREAWVKTVARAAAPFAKLSVPNEDWHTSELRRKFMQAGLRNENIPMIFFGLKTGLAMLFPAFFWILNQSAPVPMFGSKLFLFLIVLLAIGFYLPNYILLRKTEARKLEILENFPDALDLLTICVEAGSSLDSAIERVSREIKLKSEVLSEELGLVVLEMRAGAGKERALRNLSARTGVDDVDTLVAMLIQSDKFGTSVGQALRVHSDMLRSKRQQRAEEAAAKIALKLLFPLILFIFPSILIVVAGPAMIRIVKTLPTMFGG